MCCLLRGPSRSPLPPDETRVHKATASISFVAAEVLITTSPEWKTRRKGENKGGMLHSSHSLICRGFLEATRRPAPRRWWIISAHLMRPARRRGRRRGWEIIEDTVTHKEGEESREGGGESPKQPGGTSMRGAFSWCWRSSLKCELNPDDG